MHEKRKDVCISGRHSHKQKFSGNLKGEWYELNLINATGRKIKRQL